MSRDEQARWPEDYDLKPDCHIRGSNLCWKFANTGDCENCYIAGVKKDRECQEARERWDETLALIPPDVDELGQGDLCRLCVGEPEKADGWALLEMANPDPYYEKGMIFGYGKKVRSPVGSLVTVPIRIGPRCRRALRMVEVLQIGWLVGMFALSLLLLMIPQLAEPMASLFALLPVAFVVLMTVAGYYLGRNLSMYYVMRKSDEVNFDLAAVPLIRRMLARDWYFFQVNHGLPRMSFTRKKPCLRLFPPQTSSLTDASDHSTI